MSLRAEGPPLPDLPARFGAFRRHAPATPEPAPLGAGGGASRQLAPAEGAWAELAAEASFLYRDGVLASVRLARRIPRPPGLPVGPLPALAPALRPAGVRPPGASAFLWFDLETTGLGAGAGVKAFLAGVLREEPGPGGGRELVLIQHVLPDLDRVPGFLSEVGRDLGEAVWVTHNGRAFDLALWVDMHVLAGLRPSAPLADLDLLPLVRSLWRERLGSVTLSRLAREVLGFDRPGDPGGGAMPETYLAYLASGDPRWLAPALEHNAEDLLALYGLTHQVAQALERPPTDWPTADLLGLARLRSRFGRSPEPALAAALGAARSPGERARALSAWGRALKRRGDYDEAALRFEGAVREAPLPSPEDLLELAKHYEHRARDLPRALAATERAIGVLRVFAAPGRAEAARRRLEAWDRRRRRLIRRIGRLRPRPQPLPSGEGGRPRPEEAQDAAPGDRLARDERHVPEPLGARPGDEPPEVGAGCHGRLDARRELEAHAHLGGFEAAHGQAQVGSRPHRDGRPRPADDR